jgi:hypothetical protein
VPAVPAVPVVAAESVPAQSGHGPAVVPDDVVPPLPRRIPRQHGAWPGLMPRPGQPRKPTPADLGIDPAALDWQRSGAGDGCIEVAFPVGTGAAGMGEAATGAAGTGAAGTGGAGVVGTGAAGMGAAGAGVVGTGVVGTGDWQRGEWVLMRVTGDPSGRVLVFDRNEWECFLDGARNGEFDASASP